MLTDDCDESGLDRVVGQLEAVAHGELLKNVIEMRFHGALSDREALGNFSVAQADCDEANYLQFARRQTPGCRIALRGEFGLHSWRHPHQTVANGLNRRHQSFDGESFVDDGACSETQRLDAVFAAFTGSEYDHRGGFGELRNVAHHPSIHLHIEQQDVARRIGERRLQFGCAFHFGDDFDLGMQVEERFQALAKECVIVGDYQADRSVHIQLFGISISRRVTPLRFTLKFPPNSATREAIAQGGCPAS